MLLSSRLTSEELIFDLVFFLYLQIQFIVLKQAERGFAAWAVFVGRTVVFVRGKGKGA